MIVVLLIDLMESFPVGGGNVVEVTEALAVGQLIVRGNDGI